MLVIYLHIIPNISSINIVQIQFKLQLRGFIKHIILMN